MLSSYNPSLGGAVNTIWPPSLQEQLGCLTHFIETSCPGPCEPGREVAWTEGWADFFSMAVLDDSKDNGLDLDDASNINQTGDAVGERIAASLWDLMAPTNGNDDHYGIGSAPILNTIFKKHILHPAFRAFYNEFSIARPEFDLQITADAPQNIKDHRSPSPVSTRPVSSVTLPYLMLGSFCNRCRYNIYG